MSSDDAGDKTELPTDRRRQQAREQGNIARSVDLTAAVVLLSASGGLYMLGPGCGEMFLQLLRGTLTAEPLLNLDQKSAAQIVWQTAYVVSQAVIPLMLLVAGGSLAANVMQVGLMWSPEALEPKLERLNPLSGFQRIFSLSSVVRLGGSIAKILLVAGVAYLYLSTHQDQYLALPEQEASALLVTMGQSVVELGFYLALSLVGLAILDYGYQYWNHERELKMTKQELREEMKEMEGNPHVRSRRRELHRKLAEARQIGAVKTADVVITNPTEIAVAIKYDPATMPAPMVVAKGMGEIAAQIRRLAAEHGVPIIERKPLARALYRNVKVGRTIPVELYEVFVEILAYVYRITGKKPPKLS
ncbi:MAG: flagellar biosynthesis protein FlhB [Planctomycetaceae bacterium]|nr:flagellar biosynthesis protein FlhB [Planctomycetaceae bacterium]